MMKQIDTQKNTHKIVGTLVPVTALYSLKNNHNSTGNFEDGLLFLDWLKKTNQSAWQLLPLHETQLEENSTTKHVPSPYKSYGIGLDPRYLSEKSKAVFPSKKEKQNFLEENKEWIYDYSLFCALRDYFSTDDWTRWETKLKNRDAHTLSIWTIKLARQIDDHIITQWRLNQSFLQMRRKAKGLNISLIGDLAFYTSFKSPLVWAHQDCFEIPKNGKVTHVSGIPDIPHSFFGRQIWGHPLYNWQRKKNLENIKRFWKIRLKYISNLYDYVRFDHARGFFEYGVMDLEDERRDSYMKGPGADFFKDLVFYCRSLGLSVFVEDSGNKTIEMKETFKVLKCPNIRILRFAYDERKDKIHSKYIDITHYPTLTIAYTTTHDTETLITYVSKLSEQQKKILAKSSGIRYHLNTKTFAKLLRDAIVSSPAQMAIIPIQDWLLIEDRINIPGTERKVNDPNWRFRLKIPIEELPLKI